MKTHYAKRSKKYGVQNKLGGPVEGFVLASLPEDELVTEKELYEMVVKRCGKEGEKNPDRTSFASLLEDMAARGFLAAVHGSRLERLVEAV